jgi:hypothetical protein
MLASVGELRGYRERRYAKLIRVASNTRILDDLTTRSRGARETRCETPAGAEEQRDRTDPARHQHRQTLRLSMLQASKCKINQSRVVYPPSQQPTAASDTDALGGSKLFGLVEVNPTHSYLPSSVLCNFSLPPRLLPRSYLLARSVKNRISSQLR